MRALGTRGPTNSQVRTSPTTGLTLSLNSIYRSKHFVCIERPASILPFISVDLL